MPDITTSRGLLWNYEVKGVGEPVLFLHGWGMDLRIWRQQLKHFSESYKVLAVDLPGHGRSGWQKVSLDDIAQDIVAILDEMKLKEVRFVGSSFGGLVALKVFSIAPDKFKKLTLIGTLPKFAGSDDFPFGWNEQLIREFGKHVEEDYPVVVDVFFRSLFTIRERESRRFKWLQIFRKNQGAPLKPALENYLEILEKEDLRHVLGEVKVPLQLINGKEDEICTADFVEYFKKQNSSARIDIFKECGHFPFLSKPYEFNQTLEDFLKA